MPLVRHDSATPVEMFPGVVRRTLNAGERMTLHEIRFAAGSHVPSHTHPHEQTGYVASGRVRFTIAGEVRELGPGDGYHVPAGAPHEVACIEESVCIDAFAPPRTEYID